MELSKPILSILSTSFHEYHNTTMKPFHEKDMLVYWRERYAPVLKKHDDIEFDERMSNNVSRKTYESWSIFQRMIFSLIFKADHDKINTISAKITGNSIERGYDAYYDIVVENATYAYLTIPYDDRKYPLHYCGDGTYVLPTVTEMRPIYWYRFNIETDGQTSYTVEVYDNYLRYHTQKEQPCYRIYLDEKTYILCGMLNLYWGPCVSNVKKNEKISII